MFDFSRAQTIGLRECIDDVDRVAPNFEHRGAWIVRKSYEALSGWTVECRPEYQPNPIEVPLGLTGWHHVFIRGQHTAHPKANPEETPYVLRARFSDEPHESFMAVEQEELGFKDLYVGPADLTGKSLKINPSASSMLLDCVRAIPMDPPEQKAHVQMRSAKAEKQVTGMTDGPMMYRPADDQEAASLVYAHARAGFTKVYWRTLAVRCAYWTKVHEIAGMPKEIGTPWPFLARYDPLKQAVEAARRYGIEIHSWMRMNNVASRESEGNRSPDTAFRRRNPEKIQLYADGTPARAQLSFAYPEVRKHKIEIMKETVGYGVDGVMVDTLRPPIQARFELPVVQAYMEKTGRDPRVGDEQVNEEWLRFRADRTFTQLLREMRAALKEKGKYELGVRAILNLREALAAGQDVETWVKEGLVDVLILGPVYLGPVPTPYDIRAIRKMVPSSIKLLIKTWRMGSMAEAEDVTARMYEQGADGVLLYQSDWLVARPYARSHVWRFRSPRNVRKLRASDGA